MGNAVCLLGFISVVPMMNPDGTAAPLPGKALLRMIIYPAFYA